MDGTTGLVVVIVAFLIMMSVTSLTVTLTVTDHNKTEVKMACYEATKTNTTIKCGEMK